MTWVCKICDREYETIPSHAILLSTSTRGGIYVYQWDDVVHVVYQKRILKATHNREHKLFKAKDCPLCFPPPKPDPVPAPVVAVEQPKLPEPDSSEETEVKPLNTMSAAFKRLLTK